MEFMRGGRDIGMYVYKKDNADLPSGGEADWKTVVHGAVLNSIQRKGYFRIADMSAREQRLKEVARSQMIGGMKDISKELSVDGLLFIEVPMSPASECKTNTSLKSRRECSKYGSDGKCLSFRDVNFVEYTKQLIFTVYVKGRLVNLETGQAREYSNSKPAVLSNTSTLPTISCPSAIEGFSQAMSVAAEAIADQLSPEMTNLDVPIYDDGDGVEDSDARSAVKSALKTGNKWVDTENPNMDLAKKQWDKALSISGNSSAAAHWNLAIYHWSKGDVYNADASFKSAMEAGGPDWLSSSKREIIAKFKAEKDRIKLEMENEGK